MTLLWFMPEFAQVYEFAPVCSGFIVINSEGDTTQKMTMLAHD